MSERQIETLGAAGAAPVLTVAVPFYADDPTPLVQALAGQMGQDVELVLVGDGPPARYAAAAVAALDGFAGAARLIVLAGNQGRSAARNRLIAEARGRYVLFLDADMVPARPDFLDLWRAEIAADAAASFGGFLAPPTPRGAAERLHWAVSLTRDTDDAAGRARRGALAFTTCNLLVRRDVLEAVPFDAGFSGWGWEDVDWALRAAQRFAVRHIDNPAIHLGLDPPDALLAKAAQAGPNLRRVLDRHPEAWRLDQVRLAQVLRRLPGRTALCALARWLTRDPLGLAPMRARVLAYKLFRAAKAAECLP